MTVVDRSTLEEVAGWIRASNNLAVLTGAGISTESGIQDFRGPNGLWTKNPEAERKFTLQNYLSDPAIRIESWQMRLARAKKYEPNAGHMALVELERKGKLQTLVTQNVDGLHLDAGTSPDRLVEIHGTGREVVCMSCGERAPTERALERVRAGEEDPPCRTCGGILKYATISFGQQLVSSDLLRAEQAAKECDLLLAIGTSLVVYPIAEMPAIALREGAKLVIMNAEPTPYDSYADAVITDPIGASLSELVGMV